MQRCDGVCVGLWAWQFHTIRQTVELLSNKNGEMLAAQFFIEKSPPDVTVRVSTCVEPNWQGLITVVTQGAGLNVGAWFCSDAKTEEV